MQPDEPKRAKTISFKKFGNFTLDNLYGNCICWALISWPFKGRFGPHLGMGFRWGWRWTAVINLLDHLSLACSHDFNAGLGYLLDVGDWLVLIYMHGSLVECTCWGVYQTFPCMGCNRGIINMLCAYYINFNWWRQLTPIHVTMLKKETSPQPLQTFLLLINHFIQKD